MLINHCFGLRRQTIIIATVVFLILMTVLLQVCLTPLDSPYAVFVVSLVQLGRESQDHRVC